MAIDPRLPVVAGVGQVQRHPRDSVEGLPSPIEATRYHSLAVRAPLPAPLIVNAWAADGVVMGLRHAAAPIHGVQFHPESIGSEHGHSLIRAFLRIARADAAS